MARVDPNVEYEVTYKVNVPLQRVYDLLVTGIESGGYGSFLIHEGDWKEAWTAADRGAHNAFGLIGLVDRYEFEESGNPAPIKRMHDAFLITGLRVMAQDYPTHFEAFMTENDDAITGDVFLQCVVFGEVIYG